MIPAETIRRIGMYMCSECNLGVILTQDGQFIRACSHDSAIIAPMEAVATGESSLNQAQPDIGADVI